MVSRFGIVSALVLVLAPTAGANGQQRSAYEELQNFSAVLNHIRLNYVDSVTYTELTAAAIRGVLHALDPHSYYVSRVEAEKRLALEHGELFTVGVSLEEVDGAPTVLSVFRRSSAEKAGLLAGDRLVTLNDTSIAGLDVQTIALRLAGENGSKVRLGLERGPRFEPDTFSVTLKRRPFELHSVSIVRMVDSSTGFLRLEEFLPNAAAEVHDGLKRLAHMHARRVILDLRGNPGGVVTSAVNVASEFLPKDAVVFRTKGRKRTVDTTFVTKRDGDFRDLPLIVLVDERSASAAEALAASLQDHDRAVLVGRRSFGKALIQTVFFLPSGDNVWLTIGYVLTPSGRVIQRRYHGISREQYLSFAGKSGAEQDTTTVYKTDGGRAVRGGGGIMPDVVLPVTAFLPVWWSAAVDSGFDNAVSDSVAQTLPATPAARTAWLTASGDWGSKLVGPFLARVRTRLGVAATTDSALDHRLGRILAARVVDVRWGPDALEEFLVRNDPAIRVAVEQFPRLSQLLAPPAATK
ncbi:MAG TPA: S41 family peptidase [Gemmatimonadales bacterium]|nr:S41 family peptidase [Gemmatimonadales bacterium]